MGQAGHGKIIKHLAVRGDKKVGQHWFRGLYGRQLELPATSQETSGTESRFSYLCDECNGIGNPSGRIPEPLKGRQDDAIGVSGNPDIWVPKRMKRDEGLRVGCVPKKEDAGGDAERDGEGNQEREERGPPEEPKMFSVKDTTMSGEPTEGCKLRHVPGGTWLNQVPTAL
ncbi:hypothetical protein NDU88_005117 [Pleurodeles waltl]|uniref:Uncharacterized protein n=1 Tax=Pleurodeles waltl TaxID=8319 RepID=A0AAV7PEF7_PLEWA|nr:hypothetical protein NDU88_005117 [Pleurodeles waltl]